ncbi:hypothetical protein JGH11_10155 [Dysgonomonas sp. Marseille-P4677]|uniref:hypothetical protein n=1 Tax=Dysgonomonas sp. Marseille-P4677 TaxID=2364790 RepID=UPI0019149733|nr:hypothetical protein [Dysgonomonas sp. Marseille-P4677]MBK5721232.1 hypothetical protein [Dysgonomonas sp. Marseille-P4677]
MQESFKNRVSKFWKSFLEEEYQIREMMDNNADGQTLISFVDNILQIAFSKVYFEMGKNSEGKYELILTPEGDRCRLMQIYYWNQYAPQSLSETWNFYSTKPAHADPDSTMEMYGTKIDKSDIVIYPETDNQRSKINIEVYSPKLMQLEEKQRYSMFFIYLDQFISELYTMEYVGYINFIESQKEKGSTNITDLKTIIDKRIEENSWPKFENPTQIYSGYRIEPSQEKEWTLREDVFSGYTSCTALINDYYQGHRNHFDEAKENGVIFGFLFFENINIPREEVVNFRSEIEDKIISEINYNGIANSLGGATGFHFSYIDLIIYDFEAFIPIAKNILSFYNFEEVGFSYFAADIKPIFFD